MDGPDPPTMAAGAACQPPDRITLREHVREVEIGAFGTERGRRQRVRFDILCDVAAAPQAVAQDDVDGVLSYDALVDAIDAGLGGGHLALLETLAERIAAHVLRHPRARAVRVRIEKLDLGSHRLGVEIARARGMSPSGAPETNAPERPRIVLLPAGAQDDPALGQTLDRLAGGSSPVLLVATPDFEPPACASPAAARRIVLLWLEQAAWRLAAAAPGCAIAGSRTELDALLRQGAPVIWAAPRMVLDAHDAPAAIEPHSIARWLAATLGAREPSLPPAVR